MLCKLQIKCLFYPEIVKHSKTLLLGVIHFVGWVCWGYLFGVFCLSRQSKMMGKSTLLSNKGCNSHMTTN